MARKYDLISELYRRTAHAVVSDVENWQAFLRCACRNYRLRFDEQPFFEAEDFSVITNFNTPETLNALGIASSDIAEMGLGEISRTVLALERQNRIIADREKPDYNKAENKIERSFDDERADIHNAGRLQSAGFDNAAAAGGNFGQVRSDEAEISQRTSQNPLLQSSDELHSDGAFSRNRADSDEAGRNPDEADGGAGGLDREPESGGYDEVGAGNEQSEEQSAGNRESGGHLRLDYYDRSNEDKSLLFFSGDDTIREILGTTPHLKASKEEIRAFYEHNPDNAARTEYIKGIFNNDHTELILSDGRRVGYKTWQNVLQLWEGNYADRIAQGLSDHTGIVQKVENGRVYTVEGNSGDSVRQNSYPVGYYEILGYGAPAY